MTKLTGKKIKIMLFAASVVAIVVGVLRAFLLVNYIEPETGFYISGTNVGNLFDAMVIGLVAMIVIFGVVARKTPAPEHLDSKSTVVVFTSALCAFMYISLFLYGLYEIFSTRGGGLNYFLVVEIALCVPCCLNHISVCSTVVREKNTPHALLAMSEAVFFGVRVIEVFMDTTSQINVSQRSLELLMLCSMMIFFLLESAFLVNREENMKNLSRYFMAGIATIVFPVIAVLPYLAVSLFWCFDTQFVVMDVVECCVMLFAASRMLTLKVE